MVKKVYLNLKAEILRKNLFVCRKEKKHFLNTDFLLGFQKRKQLCYLKLYFTGIIELHLQFTCDKKKSKFSLQCVIFQYTTSYEKFLYINVFNTIFMKQRHFITKYILAGQQCRKYGGIHHMSFRFSKETLYTPIFSKKVIAYTVLFFDYSIAFYFNYNKVAISKDDKINCNHPP